ncbi:MAG TPA: class I mannose-6-phosphate isomerase, partial [Pseudolabrys sp.]|nr:class I mannose-6-phosphate isomerase [Pseudolabrys sp.]
VDSALLLKLLFTSQPLSIQVHPDDAFARSLGLARGKSEAWYVLSAAPDARIAVGLKQRITPQQLRAAAADGSIANLVAWRGVSPGDVILVPAGTIHAIGPGLVIAEIQQRSDATFRLFDHGRQRELHIESAVAVANPGPADFQAEPNPLSAERTLLVSTPHFVFEKIDLPPDSTWSLEAEPETWLLVVNGSGRAGSFDVAIGDAVFVQSDRVDMRTGNSGMVALVAYPGGREAPNLLRRLDQPDATNAENPRKIRAAPTHGRLETTK